MIILEGNITNKIINGANGDFSVGNFQTDIGQFKIRSTLLDQFDEGEYQVRVTIKRLGLNTYVVKRTGITITEIEADIDHLEMLDGDVKPVLQESIEPDASLDASDPLADKVDSVKPESKPVIQPTTGLKLPAESRAARADADNSGDAELKKLFGHLWPLGNEVKLDTAVPRPLFIKQKAYMAKYFDLDIKTQIWTRKP